MYNVSKTRDSKFEDWQAKDQFITEEQVAPRLLPYSIAKAAEKNKERMDRFKHRLESEPPVMLISEEVHSLVDALTVFNLVMANKEGLVVGITLGDCQSGPCGLGLFSVLEFDARSDDGRSAKCILVFFESGERAMCHAFTLKEYTENFDQIHEMLITDYGKNVFYEEEDICSNPGCHLPFPVRLCRCKKERYCSEECQKKHWFAQHGDECEYRNCRHCKTHFPVRDMQECPNLTCSARLCGAECRALHLEACQGIVDREASCVLCGSTDLVPRECSECAQGPGRAQRVCPACAKPQPCKLCSHSSCSKECKIQHFLSKHSKGGAKVGYKHP